MSKWFEQELISFKKIFEDEIFRDTAFWETVLPSVSQRGMRYRRIKLLKTLPAWTELNCDRKTRKLRSREAQRGGSVLRKQNCSH